MQVNCKVNIVNRLLPTTGQSGPSRLAWSSVTITENKSAVIELSLANARNKAGCKYKVTGNVEQIFSKFVSQGKLTIRFKQPQHDLCLSGEASQVQRVLAAVTGKDDRPKTGVLCPLLNKPNAKPTVPKTKMTILSRADYPVTTSFPNTLTVLKINGIALKKIDRRILNLKELEILDMSDNQIATLPDSIQPLVKLKHLNLSKNEIKFVPPSFFNSTSLTILDLSHNQLVSIPGKVSRLSRIQVFKVNNNAIKALPHTISKLQGLRVLWISNNEIHVLPASFQKLRLEDIDVYGNPFHQIEGSGNCVTSITGVVPTLLAAAAKVVIITKIKYREGDIPSTLITYLHEDSTFCPCGKLCIDDGIKANGSLNLLRVSSSISGEKLVPMEMTLCSPACFHRFANKAIM